MLDKPRIRLNNLKTSLSFSCLGLNPIIDSINVAMSVVPVMAHNDAQRCRGYIFMLQMNMKITSDNVIHLFLFVYSYIVCLLYLLYISVFYL